MATNHSVVLWCFFRLGNFCGVVLLLLLILRRAGWLAGSTVSDCWCFSYITRDSSVFLFIVTFECVGDVRNQKYVRFYVVFLLSSWWSSSSSSATQQSFVDFSWHTNQTIMILCLFLVSGKQRNEHSFFFISKFFVLFIWRKFIEENVSVKVQKRREHFHVVVVVVVAFENFYFALGFLLRTFYFYSRGGKREKVNSEISKWGYPRLLFN